MTKQELLETISALDDDIEIVLQFDLKTGKGFPVSKVRYSRYTPTTEWCGSLSDKVGDYPVIVLEVVS